MRVKGLGLRAQGLGLKVLGFRAQGLGFRVKCLGSIVRSLNPIHVDRGGDMELVFDQMPGSEKKYKNLQNYGPFPDILRKV